MPEKISIVFFGTGPVAAKSLKLLTKNFEVEAVITKPKPAHHRGGFPVLDAVEELQLPVHTVSNKKELSALIEKTQFKSSVGVLIDFGIIVTRDVIDAFEKGIVNSHFSLLPEWRGADPITFAILSGQKQTGVSLMLINERMDEGKIISFGIQELNGSETTPELTEKLIYLSNALIKEQLPNYLTTGKTIDQLTIASQVPDHPSVPTYSHKLTKDDGILDFKKPADMLEREVRAYVEWPKSRTKLGEMEVIITKAHSTPAVAEGSQPGDITIVFEAGEIGVTTSSGTLWIDKLKPAGKKEMSTSEFLRGYKNRL